MKLQEMLALTLTQLRQLYQLELPELSSIAKQSKDVDDFRCGLIEYIEKNDNNGHDAARQLKLLVHFDSEHIYELSTDQQIKITTIKMLYEFLNSTMSGETNTDLYLDLFMQFKRLKSEMHTTLTVNRILALTERWPSGLDEEVKSIREYNKERIIDALVQKISHRKNNKSRYNFASDMSYKDKFAMVNEWWNDFRFHLAMAIKSPTELNQMMANTLPEDTMYILSKARKKGIPFFATPYYLSLLNCTGKGYDDEALRSYIIYSAELVETFGKIHAWEREDMVEPGKPNAAGWLLPEGNNIHRRYPEVAILIPDTMGRACGGLCASCQRMYDFQSKRLNFELEELKPKESWNMKLNRLMKYFEEDTQLRDILITGGDALMSQNKTLRNILNAVYHMAERKKKSNMKRPDGEKYAELLRIRLGTRLPAYLPMRINDELVEILREFKKKASAIGIRQFIIQTHFQTPLEMTPEAAEGIRRLLSAGWLIDNQLVYNVAASRRGHNTRLREVLNQQGVVCYYTFTVKGFAENHAVFTPNSRSVQEQQEEKSIGRLTKEEARELATRLEGTDHPAEYIQNYLRTHHLPFIATDRNVLNLPGIGKSMTFRTVGLTKEGKRILCFDHDRTRQHSPIINNMDRVYIVENKSIAKYLRQLQMMGEDVEEYASIWKYTEGNTEPRFWLYEYPAYPFRITEKMTNMQSVEM